MKSNSTKTTGREHGGSHVEAPRRPQRSKPQQRSARAKGRPSEISSLLRDRILRGEIAIWERIPPERELALSLRTNRNTLREAIRTLEAEGLVRARQGDGVRVLDFRRTAHLGLLPHFFRIAEEEEQVRILGDLLRFRAALALEVVELAARRASETDKSRIAERIEDLVSTIEDADPRSIGEAELELYRVATEASGSVAALWVLNGLDPVVRHLLDMSPELWMIADGYVESWRAIGSAIAEGDGGKARRALQGLMKRGDKRLLGLLELAEEEEARRRPATPRPGREHGGSDVEAPRRPQRSKPQQRSTRAKGRQTQDQDHEAPRPQRREAGGGGDER